ncbi:hypothetical protein ACMBCN_02065 [Candidatus Liberibacter asiaticus]
MQREVVLSDNNCSSGFSIMVAPIWSLTCSCKYFEFFYFFILGRSGESVVPFVVRIFWYNQSKLNKIAFSRNGSGNILDFVRKKRTHTHKMATK